MRLLLLASLLALAACGGMNRAVTVFPQTMDRLEEDTRPLRGEAD